MSNSCGPFSQTLFLGASIIKASSSLGWNSDSGRLTVEVHEDKCRLPKVYYDTYGNARITNEPDFFNPPRVGSPVYFKFGNMSYGGILQNWEQGVSPEGGTIYSVNCIDPVEILEGTQVIINNYTGQIFDVPNLINAFGYIQSTRGACAVTAQLASLQPPIGYVPANGYGGNDITSEGMTWFDIKQAITVLANSPFSSTYGGQIQLRNTRYYLDLSEVPNLDSSFRISGDSVSLLELISQVCSAVGFDYFIELIYATPGSVSQDYSGISGHLHPDVMKFIKVRTANRRVQKLSAYNVDLTVGSPVDNRLNLGTITGFIGGGGGTVRSNRGLELRSDVTNVFLVGDNRRDLWQQPYTGNTDGFTDTIWPYWGEDLLGFPIIGTGVDDDHEFLIPTQGWGTDITDVTGANYTVNVGELRAALAGYDEWSLYLSVEFPDFFTQMGFDGSFHMADFILARAAGNVAVRPQDFKSTHIAAVRAAAAQGGQNPPPANVRRADDRQQFLFEQVKSYAENMGKRFMVALPLICAQQSEDTPFSLKLNWKPTDAAWTDNPVKLHPSIPNNEVLQHNGVYLDKFKNEEGLIECFVYFDTQDEDVEIDYSKSDNDDVLPISKTKCYVKARVEKIVFLNPVALTYPRAVIQLNQPILQFKKNVVNAVPNLNNLREVLTGLKENADLRAWINNNAGQIGWDTNFLGLFPQPLHPIGAAIPLISDNLSYGPWFTSLTLGPAAKTVYERDTSISPWSFGTTANMNNAARIKVETAVTQQIVNESGSVTLPGAPSVRLGAIIQAGGPEVTNIEVSTDISGGVTTSIRFRTFVQNFGELGRRRVENLRRMGTYQQKLQRAFRRIGNGNNKKQIRDNFIKELTKPDRFNRSSSHTLLACQQIADSESSSQHRTVSVITDERKVMAELYKDYEKKAVMDINGMFRPYQTEYSNNGLPYFLEVDDDEGTLITDRSLNPFRGEHDIEIVTRRNSIDEIQDLSIPKDNYDYPDGGYRAVGLKGPVVIVGWGYDKAGKPVPNSSTSYPESPTDEFEEGYLKKPSKWKAGPLDVRWDEEKGVWKASGGSSVKRAVLKSVLTYRSTVSASSIYYDNNLNKDVIDNPNITLHDFLLKNEGHCLVKDTNVFYTEEEQSGRLYIVNAGC